MSSYTNKACVTVLYDIMCDFILFIVIHSFLNAIVCSSKTCVIFRGAYFCLFRVEYACRKEVVMNAGRK